MVAETQSAQTIEKAVKALNEERDQDAIDLVLPLLHGGDPDAAAILIYRAGVSGQLGDVRTPDGTPLSPEDLRRARLRSAELGVHHAIHDVANEYWDGEGGQRNPVAAAQWWEKAASTGNTLAMVKLSNCYKLGDGVPMDQQRAFELLQGALKSNDSVAHYMMGLACTYGTWFERVPRDYERAFAHFQNAAEQGFSCAQYFLGWCYLHGNGTPRDPRRAVKWLLQAIEGFDQRRASPRAVPQPPGGDCHTRSAMHMAQEAKNCLTSAWLSKEISLSDGLSENDVMRWLREAADGEGERVGMACFLLASALSIEDYGVKQNPDLALEYYKKAAAAGFKEAFSQVGHCYREGIGVAKDVGQAVSWYQRGHEAGDPHSTNFLALRYEYGDGVKRDLDRAAELYEEVRRSSDAKLSSIAEEALLRIADARVRSLDSGTADSKRPSPATAVEVPKHNYPRVLSPFEGGPGFSLVVSLGTVGGGIVLLLAGHTGVGILLGLMGLAYIGASFQRIPVGHHGVPLLFGERQQGWVYGEGLQWVPAGVSSTINVDVRGRLDRPEHIDVLTADDVRATVDASVGWRIACACCYLGADSSTRVTTLLEAARRNIVAVCKAMTLEELRLYQGSGGQVLDLVQRINADVVSGGILVESASITGVHFSAAVTQDLERLTRERKQSGSEAEEIAGLLKRVEALEAKGFSRQEAIDILQTERGKVSKNIKEYRVKF